MHNFNTIKLYAAIIINASAEVRIARADYLKTAQAEWAKSPIEAERALQALVAKTYKVKLQPSDKRAVTGYTLPTTNGAAMMFSRLRRDLSGKTVQKRDPVSTLVKLLEKQDSLTLIALERQLPALIKAKQKAERAAK